MITGEGVPRLENLRTLDLRHCEDLTKEGLASIAKLPGLRQLLLRGSGVTKAMVSGLLSRGIACTW